MTTLLKESDFNLNIDGLKVLISHIESNIIGKIPEIKRLYDHIVLIINIVLNNRNKLGYRVYLKLKTELEQLSTVFNYDHIILQNIIINKDRIQYKTFVKNIHTKISTINILNMLAINTIKKLKQDYIKLVEKSLPNNQKLKKIELYIVDFRKMNIYINTIKSYKHNINFVLEPHESSNNTKHKDYMCASSVFNLSNEEYKELSEGENMLIIHKCSRKYNCYVSEPSFKMFIDICIKKSYPKIIKNSIIELYAECPCTKINNVPCDKHISIDTVLFKYNMYNDFKLQIIEKKKSLMKDIYGVDIFIRCPKPDCPNGDGFADNAIINDLINGNNSIDVSPIHKCTLCNSIWCSLCNKSHPGRICPEDGEELDPNIKKCPKCKLPTARDGGCFHMNCTACGVHWCWECNHFTPQTDAYAHICIVGNWI